MKYERPEFYTQFKEKNKYVGVRFKDPVEHFSSLWKCPKSLITKLLRAYDGVAFIKQVEKLRRKKSKVDSVFRWSIILNEFYHEHLFEQYKIKMNRYKLERLLFVHDKYKLGRYHNVPMVSEEDFTEPKYFQMYKDRFNYHNKYKFKIG